MTYLGFRLFCSPVSFPKFRCQENNYFFLFACLAQQGSWHGGSVEDKEKSNLFYDVSLQVFMKSESGFLQCRRRYDNMQALLENLL